MAKASQYLVWAIVAHLVADWLLQNDWMARNKASLAHPAAWVHGAIHFVAMLRIFPVHVAASIAVLHMLIDTRLPLRLWQQAFRQTTDGPYAIPVAIWVDQVLHIVILALAALSVAAFA